MDQNDIEVRNLEFHYDREGFKLSIPSLSIKQGEEVAVAGPSGSGKTTLAYLISGIYLPSSGSVSIGEKDVSRLNDQSRRNFRISSIGFIFQEFELLEYLNVEENILLPYYVNSSLVMHDSVKQRARALADSVGLQEKLKRHPGQLSQGEKQRLAICRALITEPGIIIADEPTGNLDVENTAAIMELIRKEADKRNATLVLITHDQDILSQFNRIIDVSGEGGVSS